MGFSAIPPRPGDDKLTIAAIDLWSRRADAAILSVEIPWADLLRGIDPETYVTVVQVPLANYHRSKGHQIWVYLDPANGLNRAGESDPLVAAGRSIAEPVIQQLFRRYAVAMDTQIVREHLGLALETNLIRGLSPAPLYAAIRQVANDAAADVRQRDPAVKLSVSVQVDYAWGHFDGSGFHGVATDFTDFPFLQELGLSSYGYLAGFAEPEELPLDYYTRLLGVAPCPSWSSRVAGHRRHWAASSPRRTSRGATSSARCRSSTGPRRLPSSSSPSPTSTSRRLLRPRVRTCRCSQVWVWWT